MRLGRRAHAVHPLCPPPVSQLLCRLLERKPLLRKQSLSGRIRKLIRLLSARIQHTRASACLRGQQRNHACPSPALAGARDATRPMGNVQVTHLTLRARIGQGGSRDAARAEECTPCRQDRAIRLGCDEGTHPVAAGTNPPNAENPGAVQTCVQIFATAAPILKVFIHKRESKVRSFVSGTKSILHYVRQFVKVVKPNESKRPISPHNCRRAEGRPPWDHEGFACPPLRMMKSRCNDNNIKNKNHFDILDILDIPV
jgi:hypothetical protein